MRLLRRRKQQTTCLAFSPDGRRLAVGGRAPKGGRVDVWEVPSGERPVTLPALPLQPSYLAFTADGGLAVVFPREVRVYGGPGFQTAAVCAWGPDEYTRPSFSPDGRWLVLDTPAAVRLLDLRPPFPEVWRRPAPEGRSTPGGAAFSPDGRRLAVKAKETVEVRDAASGAPVGSFEKPEGVWFGFHLLWSPDGRWVADLWPLWLNVWDAATGRAVYRRKAEPGEGFQDAAFHPPSGRLGLAVAGRKEGAVRLYAAGSWREEAAYAWPVGKPLHLAFSPDGTLAAAGGDEPEVVLWDVDL